MYKIVITNRFKKDLELIQRRGYDLRLLQTVIDTLANGESLDAKYKAHELKGNYAGYMECHIKADWLLIYKIEKNILVLTLTRTGTHGDLF